jgi:Phytanoyl-CoA dioxygenase (PhyH)
MSASPLTAEQREQYARDGFLLVSGLIPNAISAAAEAAMWDVVGVSPDDPASWGSVDPSHRAYENAALVACYTPVYVAAAADLAGDDPATFRFPTRGYVINLFPRREEWAWPRPHIDHAIKEHGHKTFPRAFRIAAMTYLSDIEPHGGGTVVWPGSHRKIEALARSKPEQYELMWSLGRDLQQAGFGEPLEMTPRRGDVLFYHYLCAHAGSINVRDRPRFAMNMKW